MKKREESISYYGCVRKDEQNNKSSKSLRKENSSWSREFSIGYKILLDNDERKASFAFLWASGDCSVFPVHFLSTALGLYLARKWPCNERYKEPRDGIHSRWNGRGTNGKEGWLMSKTAVSSESLSNGSIKGHRTKRNRPLSSPTDEAHYLMEKMLPCMYTRI